MGTRRPLFVLIPLVLGVMLVGLMFRDNTTASIQTDEQDIAAVVNGVIGALNTGNVAELHQYYSSSIKDEFFGLSDEAQIVRGGGLYVDLLAECLASFDSVAVEPNPDLVVKVAGPLGIAHLTGINTVTVQDTTTVGAWRWTLKLEKSGGNWRITHEHVSFE